MGGTGFENCHTFLRAIIAELSRLHSYKNSISFSFWSLLVFIFSPKYQAPTSESSGLVLIRGKAASWSDSVEGDTRRLIANTEQNNKNTH